MEVALFQDVLTICANHREMSILDMFDADSLANDIALCNIRSRNYRVNIDGKDPQGVTRVNEVVTRLLKTRYQPMTNETTREAVKLYLNDSQDPILLQEYGPIEVWDTSSVTDMSLMFSLAGAFNGDISSWDTSSVTDMHAMFSGAGAFNGDLSSWDTSSVTTMACMFSGAEAFNGQLSSWDTSSVTDMSYMFFQAHAFTGPLSSWDTSSVTDMSHMFLGALRFVGFVGLVGCPRC